MNVSVFLPSFQIAIVRCACQVPLVECSLKRQLVERWLCVFWRSRWGWGGGLSIPQVPRLRPRQLRVLRRRRDWHAALLLTASAGTSAATQCTSEEEGLAPSTFLPTMSTSSSNNRGQALLLTATAGTSEEESRSLPHNVGDYNSDTQSGVALFIRQC